MLSAAQKRRIAGRARTIHERIETPAGSDGDAEGGVDVDDVIETWCENVADGDRDEFRAWLGELGVTEQQCRDRIGHHEWPDGEPLPEWVERLDDLLAHVDAIDPADRMLPNERSVPFAEIVTALVEYATGEVDWQIGGDLLTEDAVEDLAGIVEQRIVRYTSQPLFLEFKTYLAQQDRELALADDPPVPDDPRRHYEAFVELVLGGRLPALFEEYSFLARSLATSIEQWIEAVEEFQRRLVADWDTLEARFGPESGLGRLCGANTDGDSHDGGRTTLGLTFSAGTKLVYKPRPMGAAVAFDALVDWLTERDDGVALRTPALVERDEYGWMEWAEHRECQSEEEIERYYRRAGKLLCLLYALRYTDGHAANVVAAGEYPTVVDLETLLSPGIEHDGPDGAVPDSEESILRTSLLSKQAEYASDSPPLGGLDANRVEWRTPERTTFEQPNTDLMEQTTERTSPDPDDNLPVLDGTVVTPDERPAALIDGFESMYRLLLDHRDELLATSGPLERFADQQLRLVVAPTGEYGSLLLALASPSRLRTGIGFGLVATKMGARCSGDTDRVETPALYAAERQSLRQLEVPRFFLRGDELTLHHTGQGEVASAVGEPPVEAVRSEIEGLSTSDLARQRDYLRLALGTDGSADVPAAFTAETDERPADLDAAIRRFVHRQFDRLVESAGRTDDGALTWHRARVGPDTIETLEVGDDLYGGRAGIALFGAAMDRTFDDERYREFVDDVLAPIETGRHDPTGQLGLSGDGGVIYGLVAVDRILECDRYTARALERARSLSPSRVREDTACDVVAGNAGAILGLLSLYDRTGEDWLRERARVAGDRLLAQRTETDHGPAWVGDTRDEPATGFAHGTAGIAYALGRLAAATDDDRYARTARAALRFEDARYEPATKNWRDGRPGTDGCPTTWCYGRPGIGLARLGLLDAIGGEQARTDLDRAVAGTDPTEVMDRDHVCCGNMGRIAWLTTVAERYGRSSCRDQAAALASACLGRARTNGRPLTRWPTERLVEPTFFAGESGIGYVLLRLLDTSLPSVLLLE